MTITLEWPQLVYIALTLIGIIKATLDHGKPQGPVNVWSVTAVSACVWVLLYFGGFFR